ncbi:MAG TPA: phospholipase D family protein [Gammaproteobacteria bacterium]|nr:phospholipase D family protein [Gammaproteobacteria bacterium]
MKRFFVLISMMLLSKPLFAADVSVCFTPGQNCTQQIVNVIDNTQQTLLIQAYQFTSAPIARAVVSAKQRGVDVKLILDKSQYSSKKYSPAVFFEHEGVPVWIDYKPNIAHNKVMIADNTKIITGSFNFSKNAQYHNAENMLIITDTNLAAKYTRNFNYRLASSDELSAFSDHAPVRHRRHRK